MKSRFKKVISAVLCAAMIFAGGAGAAFAITSAKDKAEDTVQENIVTEEKTETNITKDETVYVIAGANGAVKKIIVSDFLKNTLGADRISDVSGVSAPENVRGDEGYTSNGGSSIVWDANGNDIYYTGCIDKELPVDLSVSFTLDGKKVSAEDIAGKSGKVTVRFDYKNKQSEKVLIDGEEEEIYVPFVMLTGAILDNDIFKNISITNGRLVNDGDRTFAVGFALPGLSENLGVDADKAELPYYVEISADAEGFKLSNTVTVATNEIFSNFDSKAFDSFDSMNDSLEELGEAMEKLEGGASELYGGLCTLLDKSGELVKGIGALADGAQKLKDGAKELADGASEVSNGADALSGGLSELESNGEALRQGSKEVFDSLLNLAYSQITAAGLEIPVMTIENYASVIDLALSGLDEKSVEKKARDIALDTVTKAVMASENEVRTAVTAAVRSEVEAKVTAAVKEQVFDKVLASLGMTRESYEAALSAGLISEEQQETLNRAVEAQMASEDVSMLILQNVNDQMGSEDILALIDSKTEEQIQSLIGANMNSDEVKKQIAAAVEKAAQGASSIKVLKGQLDSYKVFYEGVGQYTRGVDAASDGAGKLSEGAAALCGGAETLYGGASELLDGILTFKGGVPALVNGITALRDGSRELSEGIVKFDKEGVGKLIDAFDGDISSLILRFRATADVSKDYKSFSGIADGTDGKVKFIYRTDSVGE